MSAVSVGQFEEGDWPEFLSMWDDYEGHLLGADNLERIVRSTWDAGFSHAGGLQTLCLRMAGQVAGFMHFYLRHSTKSDRPECYLGDMYIKPKYRDGLGMRAFTQALKAFCKDKNVFRIVWLTKRRNDRRQSFLGHEIRLSDWTRYDVRV